jgi:hypothetical protein
MNHITKHIHYLNNHRNNLTKQQYDTLRGKLKQGDILAVKKGLTTILSRQGVNVSLGRW